MVNCDLHDILLEGYPYTWFRGKGSVNAIEEWLDRAMVTSSWKQLFPNARLHNLVAPISNHSPILLQTDHDFRTPIKTKFRFENKLLHESDLLHVFHTSWDGSNREVLFPRLDDVINQLGDWGRSLHRKFRDDVQRCKNDLERLRFCDDAVSVVSYEKARVELSKLLLEEELF